MKRVVISDDNPSIMRIEEKCLNCGECRRTCEEATGIINEDNKDYKCLNCGSCISNCPVGALRVKYNYQTILNYIKDTDYTVIALTSPAVRVALGEEFGMNKGSFVEKEMNNLLTDIGFDYVLDTTFGADVTIKEEANELLTRIKENKNLPMFSSCCPSFVKYLNYFYPPLLKHVSTTKSPILIEGILARTYFKELRDIEKLIIVAVAPCTSKKYEIKKSELQGVDYVLTTTEIAIIAKQLELTLRADLPKKEILSESSEGALNFGISGGVTYSLLKYLESQKILDSVPKYQNVLGEQHIKEEIISIKNTTYKIAIVNGIKNLETIIPRFKDYLFIEVMNCYGGCINGGGQPIVNKKDKIEVLKSRRKSLKENSKQRLFKTPIHNEELNSMYKFYFNNDQDLIDKILHLK